MRTVMAIYMTSATEGRGSYLLYLSLHTRTSRLVGSYVKLREVAQDLHAYLST